MSYSGSTYRWRLLNLEAPPITLAPPLCFSRDGPPDDTGMALMLWRLPLRQVLGCGGKAPRMQRTHPLDFVHYACGKWSL